MSTNSKVKYQSKSCANARNFTNKPAQASWQRDFIKTNTYASAVNEEAEQWPTLQSNHSTQNRRINPTILSPNCNSAAEKKFSGGKRESKQVHSLNSSVKLNYHVAKNISEKCGQIQQRPSSVSSNQDIIRKWESPIHDGKWEKTVSKDENREGWVTVMKKMSKKDALELELEPQAPTEKPTVLAESKENIPDSEREEKKRVSEMRKQRVKEEKKMKREEKARELRERAKRDTKVNFISQDMIQLFAKGNNKQSNWNSTSNYSSPFGESLSEYPSLGSQNLSIRRGKAWPSYNTGENRLPASHSLRACNPDTIATIETNPSNSESSSLCHPKFSNQRKMNEISGRPINKEFVVSESPTKKKVKSRDLINLEIMDLIEETKKSLPKSKAPLLAPKKSHPVENLAKGKIFEGKKKRLSTLKNNVLREKKRQQQLLFTVLNGQTLPANNDSQPESSPSEINQLGDSPADENSKSVCRKEHSEDLILDKSPPKTEAAEKTEKKESIISSDDKKEAELESPNCSKASQKKTNSPESPNTLQITDADARRELVKEAHALLNPIHSNKFREYCNHITSGEIDQAVKDFIQPLIMFQRRLYSQDPVKAKIKRRYWCGLKEALKRMNVNRITCIIMVPNLKPSPGQGCVDELVHKVLNKAAECGVPVIFGLTYRELGKLCGMKGNTSCMSFANIQGVQDKHEVLMDLVQKAKKQYEQLTTKSTTNPSVECEDMLTKNSDDHGMGSEFSENKTK